MTTRTVTTLPVKELTVAEGNYDTSRSPINRIILHTMVGTVNSADARFNDPASKVSAHYGIGFDGKIVHWVDEDKTAYQCDDYPMNQRSIGIEHEDYSKYNDPRPDALYITSAQLVADICKFYNIPCDRDHIKKHSEVSDNPTGCPDALDVKRIVHEASLILTPSIPPQPALDDNTRYDFGDSIGSQTLGAIKSIINDTRRDLASSQLQVTTLQTQLTNCQNNSAKEPVSFVNWLLSFLGKKS